MTKYELLYIVPGHVTDVDVEGIQKEVDALVEKAGGTVSSQKNLGKIRLAYPIEKVRHGTYILSFIDADPVIVKELSRQIELFDQVLRHMILVAKPGAETKEVEISSYIAPLSEEAKLQEKQAPRPPRKETSAEPAPAPAAIAPPTPANVAEQSMSMEELDKKLDQILDGDDANKV